MEHLKRIIPRPHPPEFVKQSAETLFVIVFFGTLAVTGASMVIMGKSAELATQLPKKLLRRK